jgi:acylglycerol lipase
METFGRHLLSRLRGRPDASLLRCVLLAITWFVAGCAPTIVPSGPPTVPPTLAQEVFVAPDGLRLPLHVWPANPKQRAVIVALHGFNDYGNFINDAAEYWSKHGITTYAYDQRGFGDAPHRGFWPGVDALTQDLAAAVNAAQTRHPGVPVFALGESMGGAVVMTAMTGPHPPDVSGVILAAPAVWARSTMPFYQRWALWIGVHTFPSSTLTGRGLNILPSDNIPMLRALSRDPKVIKATRIDAIWGLANLMDAALDAAPEFRTPALILYGAKDELITEKPMKAMLNRLPEDAAERHIIIRYEQGYHMILRDLQAERVWRDIVDWIEARIAGGS